ncbi:MAG: hypothetical protein Q4P31_01745 [Andreesenia angusta]|nr:hypothetical protein [Andreesenia angusta]
MKLKKILTLSSFIIILTVITGCALDKAPEEMIKRPKLSEEDRRIEELINRNIPQNAKYESVESEQGLSAIKMIDIDGDGSDEILVTYALDIDKDPLHLIIFRKKNDSYSFMNDLSVKGQEFDKLIMRDINGNGKKDLVTISSDSNKKILTIYSYQSDIKKLLEIDYTVFVMDDIDEDGIVDIIVFKNINDILTGDYYKYNPESEEMEFINETINYIRFDSMQEPIIDYISKGKKGIILQGNDGNESTRYTLIFSINEFGKLENAIKDSTEEGGNITAHLSTENPDFKIKDVNKDGIVEIPRVYSMIEKEEGFILNKDDYIFCTEWYEFRNNKMEKSITNIYLESDRVYFAYPKNWEDIEITGKKIKTQEGEKYRFSKRDPENSKEELLLTIIKAKSVPDKSYRLIKRDGKFGYYIKAEKNIQNENIKDLQVDESSIIKSFQIKK